MPCQIYTAETPWSSLGPTETKNKISNKTEDVSTYPKGAAGQQMQNLWYSKQRPNCRGWGETADHLLQIQ